MLRSLRNLSGYNLLAKDGQIGTVHDFYFDDDAWTVRYLVADTGHWLSGRKVLLTPSVLRQPDWLPNVVPVSLTKEQVAKSPDINTDLPVSRQKEMELHRHYEWLAYWAPGTLGPWTIFTPPLPTADEDERERQQRADPHLRSVRKVTGYQLRANDGSIGHVADFIADEDSWSIRYLVVDTRNWLPGRRVLIPPLWLVQKINWASREVEVELTREAIRGSPPYDPKVGVSRELEAKLYEYYCRPVYWTKPEAEAQASPRSTTATKS